MCMKIIGTGSAHPKQVVTNEMLSTFLETNDEWIRSRTGIQERRVISSEKLEDLAAEAMNKALASAKLTARDIDYIICSNVVNEYITPGLGCVLQGMIGATCPTIDVNGACAGFLYGLDIADAFFKSGRVKNVLVVAAEEPSRMMDWTDRGTCVLFGDGAGAVVLTEGDNFESFSLTNTSMPEALYQRHKLQYTPYVNKEEHDHAVIMNGQDVFKMAVRGSIRDLNRVMQAAGVTPDQVDHYLLHQANIRIIDAIREYMKQGWEKFPHFIEKYGNTSSSSIPMLLDEMAREGKIKDGDRIAMSAFGAGFTTAACLLKWSEIKYE